MAKRDLPMMPWFPRDFLAATRGWSVTAKGVYRELLDVQWEEGSLPDNQEELRELIGATPEEWAIGWAKAQRKFTKIEGGRIQDLLLEQRRDKALDLAERRSKGAQTTNAIRYGQRPVQRSLIDSDSESQSDSDSGSINGTGRLSDRVDDRSHPSPSPNHTKERNTDTSDKPDAVLNLFELWKVEYNHPKAKLDDKRKKKIQAALKLYSFADLVRAIKGYKNSPHHMGKNDRNEVYDDIELFLRDAKHIDQGLKYADQGAPPDQGPASDDPWQRGPSRGVHY